MKSNVRASAQAEVDLAGKRITLTIKENGDLKIEPIQNLEKEVTILTEPQIDFEILQRDADIDEEEMTQAKQEARTAAINKIKEKASERTEIFLQDKLEDRSVVSYIDSIIVGWIGTGIILLILSRMMNFRLEFRD